MKTVRLILKTMKSGDIHLELDGLLTVVMMLIIFELFCVINCVASIFSWVEVLSICCASNHFVICDLFLLICIQTSCLEARFSRSRFTCSFLSTECIHSLSYSHAVSMLVIFVFFVFQ